MSTSLSGAASLALLGRLEEAQEVVAAFWQSRIRSACRRHHEFDIEQPLQTPGVTSSNEGLRSAGLPE